MIPKPSYIIVFGLFFWTTLSHADIYFWKDADGVAYFSNTTPANNAKLFLKSREVKKPSAEGNAESYTPRKSEAVAISGKQSPDRSTADKNTDDIDLNPLRVSSELLPAGSAEEAIEKKSVVSHYLSYGYYDHRLGDEMIYKTGYGKYHAYKKHRSKYRSVGPFKHRYYRKKYGLHYYPRYIWKYRYYKKYFRGAPIYPYPDPHDRYRYRYGPDKHHSYGYKFLPKTIKHGRSMDRSMVGARFNSIKRPSVNFRTGLTIRGGAFRR